MGAAKINVLEKLLPHPCLSKKKKKVRNVLCSDMNTGLKWL